jgi:hypothetical protein
MTHLGCCGMCYHRNWRHFRGACRLNHYHKDGGSKSGATSPKTVVVIYEFIEQCIITDLPWCEIGSPVWEGEAQTVANILLNELLLPPPQERSTVYVILFRNGKTICIMFHFSMKNTAVIIWTLQLLGIHFFKSRNLPHYSSKLNNKLTAYCMLFFINQINTSNTSHVC